MQSSLGGKMIRGVRKMKQHKIKFICAVCALLPFLVLSCTYNTSTLPSASLRIRTIMESSGNTDVGVQVFLENSDGNAVSGALVQVRTATNTITRLPFDPQKNCYTAPVPSSQEDQIHISVSSALLEGEQTFNIPHVQIQTTPTVSVLQDALGNSMLNGQNLNSAEEIQVGWDSVLDGAIYIVTAKTALDTLYSVSTESTQIIIPANTLEAGQNCFVQIEAQKIFGDPLFKTVDYYSVSVQSGANMGFTLE